MSRRRRQVAWAVLHAGAHLARRGQQLLLDVVADGSRRHVGPLGQIVEVVVERLDGLHVDQYSTGTLHCQDLRAKAAAFN